MVSGILCLVLGISVIIFAGVPIAYYLWSASDKEGVSQIEFWTIVMFAGISATCALVKILFMLNIPVAVYASSLYVLIFFIFAVFLWSKRKDMVIQNYIKAPLVLVSGMLVYGLNSIAYVLYGAKYYKGYAWWDLYYYGTQAEAVRTIPFEMWGELSGQKIWMIGTTHFTSGTHRISLGSLGALVAELAGVDGPSVTGFLFAMSLLLLFAAIMYATEGMFSSRIKQCVACIFAVMLPGVITSQLECFYSVAFMASFLIFYCKCFFDYYRYSGMRRLFLIALIISVGLTFQLDGTYVLGGLIFTSIVWMLHTREQYKCRGNIKKIVEIMFTLVMAIALNIQYLPYLWKELCSNSSASAVESYGVLNGIYGFAYLPSAFDWIFYGKYQFIETIPELFVWLLTFVAVVLFICGICGLVMRSIKAHDGICFNFLAVFCVALLFYSKPGENQYVFFKVLHFSFVPIAIGVFLFIEYVNKEFDRQRVVFKFYYHLVTVTVYVVFFFCMLCSLGRELAVIPKFQKWSGRVVGYEVISEQARELYQRMEYGNTPILLVCSSRGQEIVLWWASYYGRNRDVYVMNESELCQFLRTTNLDAPYIVPASVASDCEIISLGNATQSVFPEQKREDYAMYLEREDDMGNKSIADYIYSPDETAKTYSLYIFAREEVKAKLCISTDIDGTFSCNGRDIDVQDNKLEITLNLKKGVYKIPISNADIDFKITEYSLHISQ